MMTPIIEELSNSLPPEKVFAKIWQYPYSFFLDSSSAPDGTGRFSFLGFSPFLVFSSKNGIVTLKSGRGRARSIRGNPLLVLKELLKKYSMPSSAGDIPLSSGVVGYFSYDMKDYIEKLPDIAADDLNLPDCILGFYDSVIIFDHIKKKAFIAAAGFSQKLCAFDKKKAQGDIARIKEIISVPVSGAQSCPGPVEISSNHTEFSYAEMIRRAKDYIRKGDIYQVNLSQRFEAPLTVGPLELYNRLRRISPAPFSSFLNFGEVAVLSSSPERFILKRKNHIETRPIKGTRPRGSSIQEDAGLEEELKQSPKDNAEHIMIVDLERNDLGRICVCGSVYPSERALIEKYANVFHMVSTVNGTLKDGVGPVDCLMAAFPGGSITGAPKIRSMEIIEELERQKRSIYTGAIGYISFDGNMDTSIVIRTFIIKGDKVYFSVGGGIVADSTAADEYKETIDKAQGLFAALGMANRKETVLT